MAIDDKDIKEYTPEIEDLFIRFMVTEPELLVRCKGIVNPKHFEEPKNRKAIEFIIEHANDYNSIPTLEQIKAISGKKFDKVENLTDSHGDWFLSEYEQFARHKQLEWVILNSADLLDKGRYFEIEKRAKEAVEIGLVKDLGVDYFEDPRTRLEEFRNKDNVVSTGWKSIDEKLYGGVNRGELNIFFGQSGAGKSLFLQNLAVNWALAGLNVVYLSLELSEKLCAMRLDAMTTGYGTREIMRNIEDIDLKLKMMKKGNHVGDIQIKQLRNGCTANDIRSYLKELEVQTGRKVDAVLVDYLDLCMPVSVKVSPSDMFVKDKYVSEELRNLAIDGDYLMATASQLNRTSYDEIEFGHQHVAGGKSKIDTSDNAIGIFTTQTMRESGRYQVQFMKTRSSAGVGSKVDLKFNLKSLRILDLEEGEETANEKQTKAILSELEKKKSLGDNKKEEKEENTVLERGSRLRELINKNKK